MHHIATSINVETVVDLVHRDLAAAIDAMTRDSAPLLPPDEPIDGMAISASGSGYLQALDADTLADWAAAHGVAVRMRVRPGGFVPTGTSVAVVSAAVDGVSAISPSRWSARGRAIPRG